MRWIIGVVLFFAVTLICRIAAGGETAGTAAAAASADPVAIFWRTLTEYGALGIFLGYMMYREQKRDKREHDQKNRDQEQKAERERNAISRVKREEERLREIDRRYHELDNKLIALIEKYGSASTDLTLALKELGNKVESIVAILTTRAQTHGGTRGFYKDD